MARHRSKKKAPGPLTLFWITLGISTAILVTWKAIDSHADPRVASIQSRASKIFASEKEGIRLSFNQLAALSVALEFRDYQGAEILASTLERQIQVQKASSH